MTYHEISCFSKQIVVPSVKTYKTTGTNITLQFFKKDSEEVRFNQRKTLSAAEFDLLGPKKKRFKICRLEELQRKINNGNDLVVKEISKKLQYEGGRAQKLRQKIAIKASESDKENYLPKWWRQGLSALRNIFVSLPNNIVFLYVKVSLYLTIQ